MGAAAKTSAVEETSADEGATGNARTSATGTGRTTTTGRIEGARHAIGGARRAARADVPMIAKARGAEDIEDLIRLIGADCRNVRTNRIRAPHPRELGKDLMGKRAFASFPKADSASAARISWGDGYRSAPNSDMDTRERGYFESEEITFRGRDVVSGMRLFFGGLRVVRFPRADFGRPVDVF